MGRNKKLTNDQVREALINSRGLTTLAADELGVDWKTIMRYINASKPLQDVIQVSRHKRTQFAKSKLDEAIMRGESWAIMFTLKNKIDPDAEFVGEKNHLDMTTNGKDLSQIGVRLIDYRIGITETETRPSADTETPSQDENPGDGQTLG